jgi:hypothetical protein
VIPLGVSCLAKRSASRRASTPEKLLVGDLIAQPSTSLKEFADSASAVDSRGEAEAVLGRNVPHRSGVRRPGVELYTGLAVWFGANEMHYPPGEDGHAGAAVR